MHLLKRLALALICAVSLLGIAAAWVGRAAFGGMCANAILTELPSPDRAYRAVVFERDCGATTGFSTQVSVLRAGELLPNSRANLFIADTDHGAAPEAAGGGPEVRVTWSGARALRIQHHSAARVFLANPSVSGVAAQYTTLQ